MELPHLGEQCDYKECGQLDFLPIKCYSCHKKFCNAHFQYESHECPERYTKDVQVPVCPLCDKPVPTAKGVSPDTTVSAHIERDCKSDPAVAKRNKIYTNRCNVKKCKQKEMMKVVCDQCKLSFCLKHRHPQDHQCQDAAVRNKVSPKDSAAGSKAAQAAIARQQQTRTTGSTIGSALRSSASAISNTFSGQSPIQSPFRTPITTNSASTSRMSEDEALARAIQESLNAQQTSNSSRSTSSNQNPIQAPRTQEEQDRMLAQALAESQRESSGQGTTVGNGDKSSCIIN